MDEKARISGHSDAALRTVDARPSSSAPGLGGGADARCVGPHCFLVSIAFGGALAGAPCRVLPPSDTIGMNAVNETVQASRSKRPGTCRMYENDLLEKFTRIHPITSFVVYVPLTTRVGKLVKRHHMLHHHMDHDGGFGVSSPIWDVVFGTMPKVKKPVGARTGNA
jgi:hypothetical protein